MAAALLFWTPICLLQNVAGYASTFDPAPATGRGPALRRAVQLALADAGLRPADIDVVFADAAGVPALDRSEADAISAVFGPGAVPVTAPKTMTGRLYSGGAPLDLAAPALRSPRSPDRRWCTDRDGLQRNDRLRGLELERRLDGQEDPVTSRPEIPSCQVPAPGNRPRLTKRRFRQNWPSTRSGRAGF